MQPSMAERAKVLAEQRLSNTLPRRWRHVQAVAARAEQMASMLIGSGDREALVSAAVLHDIGYAPSIVVTGFHPLDGARWLRSIQFDDRVAALVAHHTNAVVEAELRGLERDLITEFARETTQVADLLWYCDLTTGPDGQLFTVPERLAEIRDRYEPGSIVAKFVDRSAGEFFDVEKRIENGLSPD
ncbi:HDIG domain-containing metalloprotein [Glycomyces sp. MUSA5-2]|uniref:HDIG domain-containing metalloprotein n=1 Tax=Glycomyces sp. MUSA5-2 TaxID=2053002 RepID=UPI00300816EE